jgi:hypothetical protein
MSTVGWLAGQSWRSWTLQNLCAQLQLHESIIIQDTNSGDIAVVVLRNFSGNEDILDWINSIVDENVGLRRGIRVCGLATAIFG